ncbi:hypothetical protein KP509_09G045700 [Ceratopteris richardii]|uniref:Uncharacterized protein n=1 Tax=Ceratopteris richardii TaxID=49495 RepID=A0A8T2U7M3_CERRI|nr:hypothetical protein KP509_09G045700 [Ceratopteris richardii]
MSALWMQERRRGRQSSVATRRERLERDLAVRRCRRRREIREGSCTCANLDAGSRRENQIYLQEVLQLAGRNRENGRRRKPEEKERDSPGCRPQKRTKREKISVFLVKP